MMRRVVLSMNPAVLTGLFLGAATVGSAAIAQLSVGVGTFALLLGWAVVICVIVALWPPGGRALGPPWWLNPIWLAPMAVLPGLLMAAATPAEMFSYLFGAPKFIDEHWAAVVVVLMVCTMLGALVGTQTTLRRTALTPELGPQASRYIARSAIVLFWLTVTGYVLWALIGGMRGLTPGVVVNAVLGGGVSSIKGPLHPVGGVTTLTQFGPPAAVLLMLASRLGAEIAPARVRRYLIVLVGLALLRSFVYAERLALLEVALAMVVLMLGWPRSPRTAPRRLVVTVLPLLAPIMLLIFFGTFEYLRSWSSPYYQKQYAGRSYSEFVVGRVESYYVTAFNNGVILNENDHRVEPVPWFTIRGAWDFPVVQFYVKYEDLAGLNVGEDYRQTLEAVANPEFNNQSGVLLPVYDWGVFGAGVFWLLAGGLLGRAYGLFRQRDPVGLVVYPVVFIGIVEMGRILYWPNGRALPAIVAALVVGYGIRRRMAADAEAAEVLEIEETTRARWETPREPLLPAPGARRSS